MGKAGVEHPTFTLKRRPILDVLNTLLVSFNKESLHLFLLYPLKNETFIQNVIHWTITLITPLFGRVHFKTNYNYRLSNHCFINELILVTYALISNAVEKLIIHYFKTLIIHYYKKGHYSLIIIPHPDPQLGAFGESRNSDPSMPSLTLNHWAPKR